MPTPDYVSACSDRVFILGVYYIFIDIYWKDLTFTSEQEEAERNTGEVDAADHVHPEAERPVGVEHQRPRRGVQVLQLVELSGEHSLLHARRPDGGQACYRG